MANTKCSVESATIIIACCIPVLQPLVDFLFGRRTMAGSSGYRNYGNSKSGQLKSDIEMGKGNRSGPGGNHSIVTTKHTISSSRGGDVEVDSQDSILGDDYKKTSNNGGNERMTSDGRIVRTDVVTVTYDTDSIDGRRRRDPEEPNSSWVRM